jgi:hypothetical protein
MAIKKITSENWLERDGAQFAAVEYTSLNDSYGYLMDGSDWIRNFTEPELSDRVPEEVQSLFEVARGALCYGYFFYPLYTLGFEQLFRVAEAAITIRFTQLGGDRTKVTNLKGRIDFLKNKNELTVSEASSWSTMREFRNRVSHPERQNIHPPGQVVGALQHFVRMVNDLFRSST